MPKPIFYIAEREKVQYVVDGDEIAEYVKDDILNGWVMPDHQLATYYKAYDNGQLVLCSVRVGDKESHKKFGIKGYTNFYLHGGGDVVEIHVPNQR